MWCCISNAGSKWLLIKIEQWFLHFQTQCVSVSTEPTGHICLVKIEHNVTKIWPVNPPNLAGDYNRTGNACLNVFIVQASIKVYGEWSEYAQDRRWYMVATTTTSTSKHQNHYTDNTNDSVFPYKWLYKYKVVKRRRICYNLCCLVLFRCSVSVESTEWALYGENAASAWSWNLLFRSNLNSNGWESEIIMPL